MGFPCVSAGKESASNVEDLGSIPRLGRSPGEGKGYELGKLQLRGMVRDMEAWGAAVHGVTKNLTRLGG